MTPTIAQSIIGLRSVQALYAEPMSDSSAWPARSLEGALCPLAARLRSQKDRHEVSGMVYAILGTDVASPFDLALEKIKEWLAQRALLETKEEKKLKIFTVRRFALPPATADKARASAEQVGRLLETCQRTRPQIWKMLLDQIGSGIKSRTEQQDNSSDS